MASNWAIEDSFLLFMHIIQIVFFENVLQFKQKCNIYEMRLFTESSR